MSRLSRVMRLHAKGYSARQIAKRLGFDRLVTRRQCELLTSLARTRRFLYGRLT